jgi:hypothetical protein
VVLDGGRVDGDIIIIGGAVTIEGTVAGDIRQLNGRLELSDTARIDGDVIVNGGAIVRADGAAVDGVVRTSDGEGQIRFDGWEPGSFRRSPLNGLWDLFMLAAAAALAALASLLWPRQIEVIGRTITAAPVMAGGVGLLTIGVVVPVLVVAAFTLILIPVSLAAAAVLGAAGVLGWIALSAQTGRKIGEIAGRDWPPALAAGAGALLLGLVFAGLNRIPCLGWSMQAAIWMVGLGAVVMTRVGTQSDPEAAVT